MKYDELLRNRGDGSFDEIDPDDGPSNRQGRSRSGRWGDYDGDGFLDIHVANFASPNVLYRNNGDGTFSDVSATTGVDVTGPRVAWVDVDGDAHPDIVVSWPLRVLRNDDGAGFDDVTDELDLDSLGLFPFSFAWGDADGDGDLDLFVGSTSADGALFWNRAGGFQRGPTLEADGPGGAAAWGDLDNDGDLDLVRVGGEGLRAFDNLGNGQFALIELLRFPEPFGGGSPPIQGGGVALADVNGDGALDIALDGPGRQLLLEGAATPGAWLEVELIGTESNRSGFGAAIEVDVDTGDGVETLHRQHRGAMSTYRSHGCGPAHFVLGGASSVDLRVRWPSGRESELDDVAVGQRIVIQEPDQD